MIVDLPAPFSPTTAWISPASNAERDVVDGGDATKALGHPVQPDDLVGREVIRS